MKSSIFISLLFSFSLIGCQASKLATSVKQDANESSKIESNYTKLTHNPWIYIQNQLQIDLPENKRITFEREKILKHKASFEGKLLNSEPYIYYITNQLNERNMPVELAMIPLLESAYNPLATSYAKAAGLWQIVPITAKEYGLSQNNWYDPRRDLVQSTETAINLLQYLNKRFNGDWLLTLAAYNAGEGRVRRAIEWNKSRGLPTNFWALNLSKETMYYIPRFLALVDIIRNNQQYNVYLPTCTYSNSLVKLELTKQISLDKLSEYSGVSVEELLAYNAGYSTKMVKGSYHIFIPFSHAKATHDKLKKLKLVDSDIIELLKENPGIEPPNSIYIDPSVTNNKYIEITDADLNYYEKEHKRYSQIIYRVKNGDNLSSIAKSHKVKVSEVIKWNKITNENKLKPGDKLTINITNNNLYN